MRKMILITTILSVVQLSLSAWAAPFTASGNMISVREKHIATLLPSGKVLIAGGYNKTTGALNSAEIYDPESGTFSATANMTSFRYNHTATLLPNGKVLIIGGKDHSGDCLGGCPLNTAEIYDPVAGTFTATGNMAYFRYQHAATLLPNGTVLVTGSGAGGRSAEIYDPTSGTFSSTGAMVYGRLYHTATLLPDGTVLITGGLSNVAEIYDPVFGTFTITGGMSATRQYHSATLLPNGKVLISGGWNFGTSCSIYTNCPLSSSEIYDPSTKTFTATGSMAFDRRFHSATLLPNSKIMITGGNSGGSTAEVYDSMSGLFASIESMTTYREYHTATLLANGDVVIIGGEDSSGATLNTSELYDFAGSGSITPINSMNTERYHHTATPLGDGRVLVAGGVSNSAYLNTAEVFDFNAGLFSTTTGTMSSTREYHTSTLLPDGTVLIAGGRSGSSGSLNTAEIYSSVTGIFSSTDSTMTSPRLTHTSTLLPNGEVLLAGGGSNSAEIYNPISQTFTATSDMTSVRGFHTATLLSNGKVFIAGGSSGTNALNTVDLYDPNTATFQASTHTMLVARQYHSATLLPNGKVLIAGGQNESGYLSTAEIYDPTTDTFTAIANTMSIARAFHLARLLPNGKVLLVGGQNGGGATNSTEIYDPAAGTFTAASTMPTARRYHSVTLLPDGKVLIAGGYDGSNSLNVAEIYDTGLGYSDSWRPTITAVTSPIVISHNLSIVGSGLRGRGNAEGSSGTTNSSATNYPLIQLRNIDSGQLLWLQPDPASGFSATSYSSKEITSFPTGPAVLTAFVNGIPSLGASAKLKGETTATINAPSIIYGSNGTVTITVSSTVGIPSGNVSLSINGGAANVKQLSPAYGSNPPSAVAVFTITKPAVGGYILNTSYAAQGAFEASSASGALNVDLRSLSVTASGVNKVYDGTTSATVTFNDNRVSGDVFMVYGTYSFTNKNVGSNKTINVTGIYVSGADAGNYTLSSNTASATANITPTSLTVAAAGVNKVYDGTTAATVNYSDNRLVGDSIVISGNATFSDKNAGTGKTITVTGITKSGADASNYTFSATTASTTADITTRPLSVTAAPNKTYDGTRAATFSHDGLPGDAITVSGTALFPDKNVGTGKTVSVSGVSVGGADSGNYSLTSTSANLTANITARPITVTSTGVNKVYDGTTTAAVTLDDNRVAGDVITASTSAALFANKNVGNSKTISVTGISISGADVGNYMLSSSTATATANITARTLAVNATGTSKVYDGTIGATVNYSDDRIAGDVITIGGTAAFANKNVGTGKPISITSINVNGTDAGNYALAAIIANTTANITPRPLTVTATGVNRGYDRSTNATVTLADNHISGDALTNSYASAAFSDKTVGINKTITISGIGVSGTDASNYLLSSTTSTATANILPPDGDLDGDGSVSITDALRALRIVAGLITPTATDISHADVAPLVTGIPQPDDSIDIGDVTVILRKSIELVTW